MTTYTTAPATMHSGHDIRDAKGSMVAIVHNPAVDPAKGAKIAALMAAAPDLLEALRDLLDAVERNAVQTGDCNMARAAIARATGAAQ